MGHHLVGNPIKKPHLQECSESSNFDFEQATTRRLKATQRARRSSAPTAEALAEQDGVSQLENPGEMWKNHGKTRGNPLVDHMLIFWFSLNIWMNKTSHEFWNDHPIADQNKHGPILQMKHSNFLKERKFPWIDVCYRGHQMLQYVIELMTRCDFEKYL